MRLPRAVALALALLLPVAPASDAASATPPTVRLTHDGTRVHGTTWDLGLVAAFGAVVESVGGAVELHARADGTVRQIVRAADGTPATVRTFRSASRDLAAGLNAFFVLEVRPEAGGPVIARARLPFCPSGPLRQRVADDRGPAEATMPSRCFATPVTQATVWGIDDGWGVAAPTTDFVPVDLDEGRYTATISIAPRWTRELGVAAADRRVSFGLSVADSAFSRPAAAARTKDAPDTTLDDGGGVPDLVALPPWQVDARVDARTGADLVMFASTIWNAGTGPLVVDGSRRAGAPTMTAYQSFYEDGAAVRRTRAGSFQFHDAAGHQHWHFLDFAQYSLVDRTTDARVRSEKESFCLTWTDPVDLTIPEAAWDPGSTSLQTACGTPESLSLRQLIPVGWGDTYHQQLAGQAFDVTDLPNGRYAIEVATNVDGRLTELRTDNNAASVEIELGGGRGARTVTVRDR